MRSPALSALLLGIVGVLLLVCKKVTAQKSGGKGHNATSLCAELITPWGYECIEHEAVTEDGFILGIQNLRSPCGPGGQPVLLQHGIDSGGDNWVVNGPDQSLAFILADAGFDVWISNSRTAQWSHGNVKYNSSEHEYWAWTFDQLASFDFKAATELVYKLSGKILSYIGHSQGTTILFAGLTDGRFNTTIRKYLNAAVVLAPVAYNSHQPNTTLFTQSILQYASPAVFAAGPDELSTYPDFQLACALPVKNITLCFELYTASLGPTSYTNLTLLGFYAQYFQPTSTWNLNHIGQDYTRNAFAFYDEGVKNNIALYGQPTPPNYLLESFPAKLPLQTWSGGIDAVADPVDVAITLSKLPSSNREDHVLPKYGHLDFSTGDHAYIDVYPGIIKFLKKHALP